MLLVAVLAVVGCLLPPRPASSQPTCAGPVDLPLALELPPLWCTLGVVTSQV